MVGLNNCCQTREVVFVMLLQEVEASLELLRRVSPSAYLLHCTPSVVSLLLLNSYLVLVEGDHLGAHCNSLIQSLLTLSDRVRFVIRLCKLLLRATDHAIKQLY